MSNENAGHQQVGIGRRMYFVPADRLQQFFEEFEGTTDKPTVDVDVDKMTALERDNAQMELDLKHACQCLNRACQRCKKIHRHFYPEVYGD